MDVQKNKRRKIKIIPRSPGLLVIMLLLIAVEILIMGLIAALDLIPIRYVAIFVAIVVAADFGIFVLLANDRPKSYKRLVGSILSLLLMNCFLVGGVYLMDTYDTLSKITGATKQYVEYDVVVLKESAMSEVEDIEGNTVYTVPNKNDSYTKAVKKLDSKVNVTLEEVNGCMSAGEKLVTAGGTTSDNILFISKSEYEMIDDIQEGFIKKTKVIERIQIPVSAQSGEVVDVTKDSFNFLISGVDTRGEITDVARSDVNMIVTVNPKTHTILLTSMPRDSYVPLHMNGQMDKLTHSGVYGIDETIYTIEDWLDIDIDFYARVNFVMFTGLIDAVDGVRIYNDIEFTSHPKGWHYKKGWHTMKGRYALWFVRERKSFKDEDEQRIRNQQKVVKALIEKFTEKKTLVANYGEILNTIEKDMQTSMSRQDISKLAKMQLATMPKWTIKRQCIDGKDAEMGTWSMGMGRPLFVSVPKEKSVQKVSETINEVMYPNSKED